MYGWSSGCQENGVGRAFIYLQALPRGEGKSLGVDTTPSTNPEGVALASRGREPTDTGHVSESNPEGVALALPIGIDDRPNAADRSIRDGNRKFGMSPRWGLITAVDAFDRVC